MYQPKRREPTPTTTCPQCGKEYAQACPACPYCDWVPLKQGRAKWQRTGFIASGIVISACLAIVVSLLEDAIRLHVRGMSGYVFTGGVFLTFILANQFIGGGKDL